MIKFYGKVGDNVEVDVVYEQSVPKTENYLFTLTVQYLTFIVLQ
jgi:hypothetical protein